MISLKAKKAAYLAVTVTLPLTALALVWHFGGLSELRSARDVARALEQLSQQRYGGALVPLGFAAGAALFVPVNALIAGVMLTFEPLRGFAFALGGGLAGATVSYGLGRLFAPVLLGVFQGPRIDRVVERLRRSPFRTSLLIHLLPIGNFTAANLLAGCLRVPFVGFLLGTAIGLLPGVLVFMFVAEQLSSPRSLPLVLLGIASLVVCALLMRRLVKERAQA